jgi:hypothetical protein
MLGFIYELICYNFLMNTMKPLKQLTVPTILLVVTLIVTTLVPIWTVQAHSSSADTQAKKPVAIYSNSLATGWKDWSWNATRSFKNTKPTKSAPNSIALTITQGYGALYLHQDAGLSTSGYTHLEFYVHGGSSGSQNLMVVVNKDTNKTFTFKATKSAWKKISIPLSTFGSPAAITDIYWQDAAGKAQPKLYLDAISLVDKSVPTPTVTKTKVPPTVTKTKVPPTVTKTKVPPTATKTSVAPTATKVAATATLTTVPTSGNPATTVPTNPAATATAVSSATALPPTATPAASATATVKPSATATSSGTAKSVTIYADSVVSGWQDWSWSATHSFTNTSPVQSGSASISLTITSAWGALYLHNDSGLNTSGYNQIEFYINGGSTGGQNLWVIVNGNTGSPYSVTPTKNAWTKVVVPLTSVGTPSSITDIYWQDAVGTTVPVVYIDSISLVSTGVALPTATATKVPTTAPSGYFAMLPPGSTLPSDAQCAAAVKAKSENKGLNKTYNATKGNQSIPASFFSGDDALAGSYIAPRVTGNFTGTTDEILQWAACKWGFDEDVVRAEAAIESWWHQNTKGDWTTDSSRCAPGHGLGVDGTAGQCPESFGILQNRYPYEQSAWPGMYNSTAFNADVTYAELRACYEGYETWLNTVDKGATYAAGDMWGCVGRWYAGRWHTSDAETYITRVKDYLNQRIWEQSSFQEP